MSASESKGEKSKHQKHRRIKGTKTRARDKKILCKCSVCKGQVMVTKRLWKAHQNKDYKAMKRQVNNPRGGAYISPKRPRLNSVEDPVFLYDMWNSGELEEQVGQDAPPLAASYGRECTRQVDEKLVFANGYLRRGTILDLLVEQASAHNIPREAMEGIVDIINLIALDGGADEPILPSYAAFDKALIRAGKEVVEKYLICSKQCDGGCMPYRKGYIPNFCTACGETMDLTEDEVSQSLLRHFNVAKYLEIILCHPGVCMHICAGLAFLFCCQHI